MNTDPATLPNDVKLKLLAARDALTVGDVEEAYHQIYAIASPGFNKLADEVWTALETPTEENICPTCKGKGATAPNGVQYCNCINA